MPTSHIAKTGKGILDLRKEKLRPMSQTQVRAKIQVTAFIKVIQNHALGIGDEVSPSRIHAAKLLIDKVLPNAIPESVELNNNAQALQAVQQAQLLAMAKEMLNQSNGIETIPNVVGETIPNESVKTLSNQFNVIDSIPTLIDDSKQSLTIDESK